MLAFLLVLDAVCLPRVVACLPQVVEVWLALLVAVELCLPLAAPMSQEEDR